MRESEVMGNYHASFGERDGETRPMRVGKVRAVPTLLSPLLANIALHGLEDGAKKAGGPVCGRKNGIRISQNTLCIRYADDFVVFHNTWEGIQRCKETIQEWLKGRGLELKDAKTRYAHTLEAKEKCNG